MGHISLISSMPNGPKWYLVLATGNRYSPSMTLRFIKTSPFKYLNGSIMIQIQYSWGTQYSLGPQVYRQLFLPQLVALRGHPGAQRLCMNQIHSRQIKGKRLKAVGYIKTLKHVTIRKGFYNTTLFRKRKATLISRFFMVTLDQGQ